MTARHAWAFVPRFRCNAFGWRSDGAIRRLREAVSEIRLAARTDRALAAEGAIVLLEKLVPAIEGVDGSSGAMGGAVNRALDALVPLIAQAPWSPADRQRWLDRLWQAVEDDGIGYIEALADHWGTLCVERTLAERWVAEFKPVVERIWSERGSGFGVFKGTSACLSCMLAAGQHEALLTLLERAPFTWWHDRRWGVQALVALGRKAEALRYAEASRGLNDPPQAIALVCERILLSSGLSEEAYRRHAIDANRATTHLATFRAIARKYPGIAPVDILRDLVAASPGGEGKWFAAAKDAGLYERAIELARTSPADPRTLNRAARDLAAKQPAFALEAALASLHWIALGHGYEVTGLDALDAWKAAMAAGVAAGLDEASVRDRVRGALPQSGPGAAFVRTALGRLLTS